MSPDLEHRADLDRSSSSAPTGRRLSATPSSSTRARATWAALSKWSSRRPSSAPFVPPRTSSRSTTMMPAPCWVARRDPDALEGCPRPGLRARPGADPGRPRCARPGAARRCDRRVSFGFRTKKDAWRQDAGVMVRELLDIEIAEISLTAFPAYRETDVSVAQRSLQAAKIPTDTALLDSLPAAAGEGAMTDDEPPRADQHDMVTELSPDSRPHRLEIYRPSWKA